ncbi:transferase family protein [Colletotrichum tofieldiae]|nr:transferase family protein [Colletotrichum tofieldiae]
MNHAVADATTIIFFMQHWSRMHECMFSPEGYQGETLPEPIFAPHLVDEQSARALEGRNTPSLLAKAQELPTLRNELYTSKRNTTLPDRLEKPTPFEPGDVIPVGDWDQSRLMASYMLHFPKDVIDMIWEAAREQAGPNVSRQAAVVSYIWLAIARSRGWEDSEVEKQTNFFMTLDMRRRLGLPSTLLGSTVTVAHIKYNGYDAISKNHGHLASRIWDTLSKYDEVGLRATLLDVAEGKPLISPAAWLSGRSILYSSLCHTNMYAVSFDGMSPALASPAFAGKGGMIGLLRARPVGDACGFPLSRFYDEGINMFFELDRVSLTRLLEDPAMQIFRRPVIT